MATLSYLNFDLLIERTGDRYRARVLKSPGGEASLDFDLPFTREQLQIFILKAISLGTRRQVRRIESPDMKVIKSFGRRLFEAVFDAKVHDCLRLSLHEAERRNEGLRIRLRIDDGDVETDVALSDVPWEFLYDEGGAGFLCLSSASPLVRYQDLRQPIEPVAVKPPLRLLVMISAPRDAPQLDVENEQKKLDEALHAPIENGLITIDRMEVATLQQLQRRLRVSEYHAFHFIGHGGFDEQSGAGELLLEDERGRSDPVSGEFLRTLFQNHRTLRLAILNACEGARTDPSDPFAGVAQSLVRGGVPAVIAMQFEISDDAAIILSSEFYSALADGYPVDAALAEARTAVYTRASAVEWAVPVLYLRSPDASIFDLEGRTPLPLVPGTVKEPPSERSSSVEELPAVPKRTMAPPEPKPGPPAPVRSRRSTVGIAAAALALLVGLVFAIGAVTGDGPSPSPSAGPTTGPGGRFDGDVLYVREGDVWSVDPVTREEELLVDADANDLAPSLSPDQTQVVFGGGTGSSTDLFIADTSGSAGPRTLPSSEENDDAPDWSPDGQRIVFESDRDGDSDIYSMDLDGSDLVNLTKEFVDEDLRPDWSPDGSRIAFISDRDGDFDIFVMDARGNDVQQLTETKAADGVPVWSPDGRSIAYRSNEGGDFQVWQMSESGMNEHQVTHDPGMIRAPAWSPEGSEIVYSTDRDGDYDLWVVDVETEEMKIFLDSPEDDRGPTWCCYPPANE